MNDEELKQLIASNAKAIQALTSSITDLKQEWRQDREEWRQEREEWRQERKEWRQDRRHVFEWMARLAAAQADFYEVQADYLNHVERIDERLAKILERLTPNQDNNEDENR